MSKVKIALAVGVVVLAAVAAVALTRAPSRLLRVGVPGGAEASLLANASSDISVCQPGETLPAGVSDIRLSLWAWYGAPVHVRAYSGSRILTEGSRGPDWTSDSVTVPVKPLKRSTSNVKLCFAVGPSSQPVLLRGGPSKQLASAATRDSPTPKAAESEDALLRGKVGVEYLAAGQGSWFSRVSTVAKHMGLGRAYAGTWIAFLVAALMAAVGVLAIRLTLRELP